MKTSWYKLQQLEDFLQHSATGPEKALLRAKMLIEPGLREDLEWQQRTYRIIGEYGRRQLRREIAGIHEELFSAPPYHSFRNEVMDIFRR